MALGPKHLSKKHFAYMHGFMLLSLLALWGYLSNGNTYLALAAAISFYGSLCFAFKALAEKITGLKNPNID